MLRALWRCFLGIVHMLAIKRYLSSVNGANDFLFCVQCGIKWPAFVVSVRCPHILKHFSNAEVYVCHDRSQQFMQEYETQVLWRGDNQTNVRSTEILSSCILLFKWTKYHM